ncbi:hypothetical protein K1719_006992 [Acacia pycnantha]|nr:hypothetical protein K1719_006992 [Acacia pycnantha]
MAEEKWGAKERGDYTEDGTVDLKGRPVLRSKTGRWRACYFILGYEAFERFAYFGIGGNLVLFLTKKLHEGTAKSATNVTNWSGTVWITPLAGAYIADAHLSRYWTFLIAALIYLLACHTHTHTLRLNPASSLSLVNVLVFLQGLCMLTLTVSLKVLRPPPCSEAGIVGTTQHCQKRHGIKLHLPILIASFVPGIIEAHSNTLFVRQGSTLDRSIGSSHFQIPPASLIAFVTIFTMLTIALYDIVFIPLARRYTNNPRGITLLQKFGIGLVIHIIIMVTACLAERKRLSVARENQVLDEKDKVPLSIFILLPQFALVGVANAFVEVAKIEFFYDQAPQGMKSLGTSYFTTSNGIGYFLSSFVLSTVAHVTKRNGQSKGWILDNLNISRLDYYYAFLAVLCFLNLVFFLVVSKLFVYNVDVTQPKSGHRDETPTSQAAEEIIARIEKTEAELQASQTPESQGLSRSIYILGRFMGATWYGIWAPSSSNLEVGNQVHQDDPVNEAVRDAFGVQDDNFTA